MALVYTKGFRENHPTQIGVLYDGIEGTLTYYKDGKCLGVAFRGLDKVSCESLLKGEGQIEGNGDSQKTFR